MTALTFASVKTCVSSSWYMGLRGTMTAPAFQMPYGAMRKCGEFCAYTPTASPGWIPDSTR